MLTLTLDSPYAGDAQREIRAVEFLSHSGIVDHVRVNVTGIGFAYAQTLKDMGVEVEEFGPVALSRQ